MRKIFEIAKGNSLFEGIAFSDFEAMLNCLSSKIRIYYPCIQQSVNRLLNTSPPSVVLLTKTGLRPPDFFRVREGLRRHGQMTDC